MRRYVGYSVLAVFGLCFAASGLAHLRDAGVLRMHYVALGWPAGATRWVGIVQIFGGVALTLPRWQRTSAVVIGLVMVIALLMRVRRASPGVSALDGSQAVAVLAVCALGLWLTRDSSPAF